jgi:hypothetical protein
MIIPSQEIWVFGLDCTGKYYFLLANDHSITGNMGF